MPITSANRIVTQPVSWLWPQRLAVGKLTLLDGDPSQGKSLLALDLAARLTTAQKFPDGCQPTDPHPVPGPNYPTPDPSGSGFAEAHIWQLRQNALITVQGSSLKVDLDSAVSANPGL